MGGVAQVAIEVLKWMLRIGLVLPMLFAWVLIMNIGINYITVGLSQNLVTDLLTLLQIWMPFDINIVFAWVWTCVTAYFGYKLTLMAIRFLNHVLGRN